VGHPSNIPVGEGLTQAGDIMSGPLLGVSTLAITQNPRMAQRFANYESVVTAGAGAINSKTVTEAITNMVDLNLQFLEMRPGSCAGGT